MKARKITIELDFRLSISGLYHVDSFIHIQMQMQMAATKEEDANSEQQDFPAN